MMARSSRSLETRRRFAAVARGRSADLHARSAFAAEAIANYPNHERALRNAAKTRAAELAANAALYRQIEELNHHDI
jgi:hypothetical protein